MISICNSTLTRLDLAALNLLRSPLWIVELDQGVILWANPSASRLIPQKFSENEFSGYSETWPAIANIPFPIFYHYTEQVQQGNTISFSCEIQTKVLHCYGSPILLASGETVLFIEGVPQTLPTLPPASWDSPIRQPQSPPQSNAKKAFTPHSKPLTGNPNPETPIHPNPSSSWKEDITAVLNDCISRHDLQGNILEITPTCQKILGYSPPHLIGQSPDSFIHPQDRARVKRNHHLLLKNRDRVSFQYRIRHQAGHYIYLESQCQLMVNPQTQEIQEILAVSRDVTDREMTAHLLASQRQVLEMIATNQDLEKTLTVLIQAIEKQSEGMIVSILFVDATGQFLRDGIAPSLSQSYRSAMDGLKIGDNVGSCGTAAYHKKTVIVSDLATDPRWEDHREIAIAHKLRSCWSTPILSSQEKLLGTFAIYYHQPRLPSNEDQQLIEFASHLAGIAIEHKQAQEATRQAEAKYRSIFENIAVGIFQTTPQGQYISANPALAKIYGYDTPEELVQALTNIEYQLYVDPDRRIQFIELLKEHDTVSNFESQVYCRDGSIIWIVEDTRAVRDDNGTLLYYEGTVQDITARRMAEERLLHSAMHDALTGLPNRVCFTHQVHKAIAKTQKNPDSYQYAVLFLDLDRFKVVNDSLGHLAGDQLLQAVAKRLQSHLDPRHTIARLGGDEFAILLEEIGGVEDAIALALMIQTLLHLPFQIQHHEVFTGTSIGIAYGNPSYSLPEDLLRDADVAMYRAKFKNGGQYEIFNPMMQIHTCERLQLENDLRRGIDRDEFVLFYQPIICLSTGILRGFEALVRWKHPQRGYITPSEFIPVAEETGLIYELGWRVLQQACQQLSVWQQQKPDLLLNVNISSLQLKQVDFVEQVYLLCQQNQLHRPGLKLEITESCILEPETLQSDRLKKIKGMGIGLCIDDFGTGYSSLARLHEFPIDTVKIDRSFVQGLECDRTKTEIVKTIITLAHRLGMNLVAEGVETSQQAKTLKRLGCEFAQGYLYSPAVATKKANLFVQGIWN